MIERVARAQADIYQELSGKTQPWDWHVAQARAAIAAMRNPTDEMIMAGSNTAMEEGYTCILWEWQAMIDVALEQQP